MKKIVLAGNPNVGKSTIFNALTGMHQHTGNWAGKTVSNAVGEFNYHDKNYELIDLPGTYSLISHSEEESISRNFLCFDKYDCVVVVCDCLCLERNLNLVFQILEITPNVIVCVNLLDEAKKKKVKIDLDKLAEELKVEVVGMSARSKKGINNLLDKIELVSNRKNTSIKVEYQPKIEEKIDKMEKQLKKINTGDLSSRWLAIRILEGDIVLKNEIKNYIGDENFLLLKAPKNSKLKDYFIEDIIKKSEDISKLVITYEKKDYDNKSRKIDKLITSKWFSIPFMLLLLMVIFWITITGANYPSDLLFKMFSFLENKLLILLNFINTPSWLSDLLVGGIFKTLGWVISVMLPPMAIFFPLFTLLEDLGILPRIAFNVDKAFQKCRACGKQALCMMMGFGCNAAGVVGTRIIDSKRERLIAILTNVFVPCNGRFPMILVLLSMFFIGNSKYSNILEVFLLILVILLGIGMTFLISFILSKTLLKGMPSSFTLELPPYRKPQIIKVIVRSIFDKTLHILYRAIIVTIPTGIIIWIMANLKINNLSILTYVNNFFDPFGKLIGLDGVIITAFILGFPANEIVIPIMLMSYLNLGTITDYNSIAELKTLLINNNWTFLTALNMIILCLMHFPCGTTCLTIKKETGSIKWMLLSIIIPTLCGIILCLLTTLIFNI